MFDPNHRLVTSPWFSPKALCILRGTVAVYILVTLLIILVTDAKHGVAKSFFSYFTQLTYIGLCAYYFAAFTQSFFFSFRSTYPLQRYPKVLQVLHLALQSTILTYPILVTIVFWALLASPNVLATTEMAWRNISVHALNSAFALLEMIGTDSDPIKWIFLVVEIVGLGGYVGVAYITHITQGFYTYPFLNPNQGPILAAYIVGIAVAQLIIHVLVWGVMKLRVKLTRKDSHSLGDEPGNETGDHSVESHMEGVEEKKHQSTV